MYLACAIYIVATVCAVFAACKDTGRGDFSPVYYGDFPAFYTAAKIIAADLGHRLYDFDLQQNIQRAILQNNPTETYMAFVYPPYTAAFFLPFAWMLMIVGKWLLSALMALALFFAVRIVSKLSPFIQKNLPTSYIFFFSFFPILLGLIGSQNTALSMLLYAGALWGLSRADARGQMIAGLCLGLWLFKPQYALPVLFLFVLSRSWKILGWAGVVAAVYYSIGAAVSGFNWPLDWLRELRGYDQAHFAHSGSIIISIPGVISAVRVALAGQSKVAVAFSTIGGYCLACALYFWLARKFISSQSLSDDSLRSQRLQYLLELAGPVTLLVYPLTGYYDIGICLIACARYVRLRTEKSVILFFVSAAAIVFATIFRRQMPVNLLSLATLGILWYLMRIPKTNERVS